MPDGGSGSRQDVVTQTLPAQSVSVMLALTGGSYVACVVVRVIGMLGRRLVVAGFGDDDAGCFLVGSGWLPANPSS